MIVTTRVGLIEVAGWLGRDLGHSPAYQFLQHNPIPAHTTKDDVGLIVPPFEQVGFGHGDESELDTTSHPTTCCSSFCNTTCFVYAPRIVSQLQVRTAALVQIRVRTSGPNAKAYYDQLPPPARTSSPPSCGS